MPSIKLSATNTNLSHKFHFFARKQPLFLAPGRWPDCNSGGRGHAFPDEEAANGSGCPSIGASGDDHGGFHSGTIQKSLVYFMGFFPWKMMRTGKTPLFFTQETTIYTHTHCCIWNMCTKGMPLTEEKLCFKCVSLVLHVFPGEIEPHRQLQSLSVSSKSLFSCSETFLKSTTKKTHIFSGLVTKFHCWPTTRRWMGWNDPASLVSQVSPAGFRETRSCCPFPPEGHKPLQLATSYLWLSIYFKSIHSCIFVWF